jgi:putative membrane protein
MAAVPMSSTRCQYGPPVWIITDSSPPMAGSSPSSRRPVANRERSPQDHRLETKDKDRYHRTEAWFHQHGNPMPPGATLPCCKKRAMKILLRILVSAVALGIAAWVVPGIVLTGHDTAAKVWTLLIVAVIFGLINAVLKPIIKTVGCAFYILTLGLVAIVVNGLLLWLTSYIVYDKLHEPFHITGFVAAVEGALIVGVVTWLLHLILRDED